MVKKVPIGPRNIADIGSHRNDTSAGSKASSSFPEGSEKRFLGRQVLKEVACEYHVQAVGGEGANQSQQIEADFVLLLVGYEMDTSLLTEAGVELVGPNRAPKIDAQTMATNIASLYVIGTAAAGTQLRFKLFIENCHPHVVRVMRALTGQDPKHVNILGFQRLAESRDTLDAMLES